MSLQPGLIPPVPQDTAQIALAAFPDGHPDLRRHDQLGNLFTDANFADLDSRRGQYALAPWRLALIVVVQFREDLSDHQAADALRARIDWIYLLGLELADPGLDDSDLCEFHSRLITTRIPPDREQRSLLA